MEKRLIRFTEEVDRKLQALAEVRKQKTGEIVPNVNQTVRELIIAAFDKAVEAGEINVTE